MGTDLVLPESFKGKAVAQAFAGIVANSLADGIGQSYPVIGYQGRNLTLRYRGQRYQIVDPQTGTPATYLDYVVLGAADVKSKSYYKKYVPGSSDGERPLCSSMNGVVPDADIAEPQHSTCGLCPRNAWKVQENGRKGKECQDYKRLAVLILPNQTVPILKQALLEPVFLRIPPASLNALAMIGEQMDQAGFPYYSYVTRLTFDLTVSHPQMVFTPIHVLGDDEAPVVAKLLKDPQVSRIINGDFTSGATTVAGQLQQTGLGSGLTGVVGQTASASVQQSQSTSQAEQTQASSANEVKQSAGGTGLGGNLSTSTAAQPATQKPTASATVLGAGLSGLTASTGVNNAQTPPPLQAAPLTAADAGNPEDSDSDLDARLAAMIVKGRA